MSRSCNFIDGQWTASEGDATLNVYEPATGRVIGTIADSTAADVDRAVRAAREAFDQGAWGKTSALDRSRLLLRLGTLILRDVERLAQIEARDTGKPASVARADIVALARYFEFYGAAADKLHGETIPYLDGYFVTVTHEPHGVTGHILPWNYPAQMFGRTLAPALAVGNATVLKPAEDACATALALVDLLEEAGFPRGAVNIVTGRGAVAGAALAAHPGVDFVSFTGSPEVGQIIQKLCADHFITCTLELGGKSPQIVFADADLDAAIPVIVKAIIQNSGQTCSAGSRILIERSAYDEVIGRLRQAFGRVRVGTPEMDLDCGPIITAKQQARVQGFIDRAIADGVPVLAQGVIAEEAPADGFYVRPTLFGPTPRDNLIAREEVFGPVLVALPFDDEADAVALANGTDYGLVAAVWTRDGARQMRLAKRVRTGQMFVNCYGAGAGIELPFGGSGKSGHGREKGFAALHDFSKTKTTVFNHG
ncbi:Aldehyde Dehydrogenase [Methylorubrum populi BJ001]|jgi:aldehyde dehydrogenase (NAD+)|uniref:Aldehyde Dehydrogenase n=1 Tax=Methylorubrum populi (strain ATCC BAA-705 / NCIMB 13946 / BJ001) TaxID=441620 RepID=B1ZCR0_METPB|nr:aldehyde dehydrogenase family protein [Methylorubrum populi]ACB79422.1 Aldehyde Dehydrogenase [Methylorubrum populi BJ001]OAH37117.1 aldehyde dehydrogenase [Methylorubrum populi]PZP69580.1 MAG: aldehyde dehydrogenase [Methylorubrum populi]